MTPLLVEIAIRLSKVLVALVIGIVLYLILTGPVGAAGSAELFLLSFLAGAVAVLLAESSPI